MPLAPGTRLGPYDIVGRIGVGGMGEVWKARDSRLGRDVAIKVLPPAFAADPDRLKRFELEARAVSALNHPNILSVFDIGSDDGSPFLVMELLEGESLRERLGGRGLPVKKAVEMGLQLAHGLAAAHEKGVLHRDLKPENVFLTKDGRVKILDFGLAKLKHAGSPLGVPQGDATIDLGEAETAATEPGFVLGTVGYMSPEQVRGESLDGRSDIFALGIVLWEMVTGQRPFRGDSALDTLQAILKDEPPDLVGDHGVSPTLERILHGCLAKEPAGRFHSAHDLAFALETLTTATSSGATIPPPTSPWRRWRSLGLSLAGAAVLLGLGLASLRRWPLLEARRVPTFTRLTFWKGEILSAAFAPDAKTIVYSANWEGRPYDVYQVRTDCIDSRPLGLPPGTVLIAMSSRGELAVSRWGQAAPLARVPISGGSLREVTNDVYFADWSPNGQELAVIRDVGGRHRLEYPIGTSLYETDNAAFSLKVSPSGQRLAFIELLSGGAEQVVRVVGTDRHVDTISLGMGFVLGLAWERDEQHLIVSWGPARTSQSVWEISLKGERRLLAQGPGSYALYDVHPDGRMLMEHYMSHEETWLVSGDAAPIDLSWLGRAKVKGLSRDGQWVLLDDPGERGSPRSTWLRRRGTRDPVRLSEGSPAGDLSPDGAWVPVLTGEASPRFLLIPTGAGTAREVPLGGLTPQTDGLWLPEGRLLFRATAPHTNRIGLYVVAPGGGQPTLLRESCPPLGAISPDGAWVAVMATNGSSSRQVALLPLAGGSSKDLPFRIKAYEQIMQWSADGKRLFLASYMGPALGRIEALDLATGERTLLRQLHLPMEEVRPLTGLAITPDGSTLAYSCERVLVSDLYLVEGLK